MDYEKDIKIDDSSLDIEFAEQAALFMKYSKNNATMELAKDRAKEKLEFVKAELDKDIRTYPGNYGLDKITDKVVENTIPLQQKYKEASEAFLQAKFEWGVAKGATDAFGQGSPALEGLAKLLGQQYFAGPKVPRDLGDERRKKDEASKELDARIPEKLSIRRRTQP